MIKQKLNEDTLGQTIDTEDGKTIKVSDEVADSFEKAANVLGTDDVYSGDGNIEKVLNRCLVVAKRINKQLVAGTKRSLNFPNVTFEGEAGTGKTARIKAWAIKNNVNLVTVSAATMDDTDLGGALAPDLKSGVARKLASTQFDELGLEADSVLFLDEWNRAPDSVRGTLLTLVQNHTIPDPRVKGAQRLLPNFLFTVAAINPYDPNYNTNRLDDAELTRSGKYPVDSDKKQTLGYITHDWMISIKQAETPEEKLEYERQLKLADKLLRDRRFLFDNQADRRKSLDAQEEGIGNGLVLNARTFTNLLTYCDGTKEDFINLWNNYCNSLKKETVQEILADYVDVEDKANDALKGGTDSNIFKSAEENKKERINSIRDRIKNRSGLYS
jgi:hypothetical protein